MTLPPPPRPAVVFLTATEVAARLRVSKMTVYRLIHDEDLRAFRIGRSLRIRERDLNDYLRGTNTIDWERPGGES